MPLKSGRQPGLIALIGTLVVLAYATLASLQIAVLNPLAAAPGRDLAHIQRDMATAGESMGIWWVVMAVGPLIAIALLFVALKGSGLHPRGVSAAYLGLLALGAPAYLVASFGPGMALADTYAITGADHSPWAVPLYVVSALSLAALIVVLFWRPAK